ncbi:MAG: succinate--CoA ligase subunit alpha [Alphaproteobacteria bacterium]|nr:succinate--CoA ligase subunit alpha [Alphaproteobacteria bacterium]
MAVLINKNTKIMVQGITGTQASFHIKRSIDYGTNIVCGVTPGKGGITHLGVPVFDSVKEAYNKTQADTTILFVPGTSVKAATMESLEAGIKLIVCISNNVPVHDMLFIRNALKKTDTVFIGPETPGIITPDEARLGIFPLNLFSRGKIGILSRSSTLTYEAVLAVNKAGFGQSSVIGLGDGMIIGMDFVKSLELLCQDDETQAIVMIGQQYGEFEEEGAKWYKSQKSRKPVICYIAGSDVDENGHTIEYPLKNKLQFMRDCGIIVADELPQIYEKLISLDLK